VKVKRSKVNLQGGGGILWRPPAQPVIRVLSDDNLTGSKYVVGLLSVRLPCSFVAEALLGSYAAQAELGDYAPQSHAERSVYSKIVEYSKSSTLHDDELLDRIAELHRTHRSPIETSMSPLDHALYPHIPALQRAQNVTPHLYNTDYYIIKLNRLNIICLLKHSLVSSTIVISVVATFSIALAFLNLYGMLLFIVKSSLQCATEIIN